jgi:hypothetical protein
LGDASCDLNYFITTPALFAKKSIGILIGKGIFALIKNAKINIVKSKKPKIESTWLNIQRK